MVLPCLDEAEALPWVLDRLPAGFRAVVADNGSTDGSADLARAHGAQVVDVPQRGYGAAVDTGLRAATSEVVCVMDADASMSPEELPALVAPVLDGTSDLVLGRRVPQGDGAWPLPARLANIALMTAVRAKTGTNLRDLGPMRAANRQALLDLQLRDRRFGYPLETVLAAHDAGWRMREIPIDYRPRTGASKVTGTPAGYLRTVKDMWGVLSR